MRITSTLTSVGKKGMGEVPSIGISQPFVPTVANSAIPECKFLDVGKKKKKREKAKQVPSASASFTSSYIASLLAQSVPCFYSTSHLVGFHYYYPSLPKASLSVQSPYSSLYAEFPWIILAHPTPSGSSTWGSSMLLQWGAVIDGRALFTMCRPGQDISFIKNLATKLLDFTQVVWPVFFKSLSFSQWFYPTDSKGNISNTRVTSPSH